MELIIYAPKEDGFIKSIDWNFEELKQEIEVKAADYMNLVYSDDQIKEAKKDRADLNKFKKALEDKRKDVKAQVMDPYKDFEVKIKELVVIVDKAVDNIDSQIKGYEEGLRQAKEKRCREIFDELVGDLDRVVTFEKVFNPKWLNRSTSEKSIKEEIKGILDKVDKELKAINSYMSPFIYEMKEEYLKEFNLTHAIEVKNKLTEAEEKKAVFEAERKRIEAEKRAKLEEEARTVHEAGVSIKEIRIDENGDPYVADITDKEKVIEVTFRVTARESQFEALNRAITMLKNNSEKVEMLDRKEI